MQNGTLKPPLLLNRIKPLKQLLFKNKNNTGYYTTTSNKLEDGTYDKNFITVGFRKGVELDNFTKINIKNGFLTHYSYQNEDGETIKKFKIMVMDFDVIETYSNNNTENTTSDEMSDIYPYDDLPF